MKSKTALLTFDGRGMVLPVLLALALLASTRMLWSNVKEAAACAQTVAAVGRLDKEVTDARRDAQAYVGRSDSSFKAAYRGAMDSARNDLQLVESSPLQNGPLQADARQAEQEFETIFSWLDLAIEQQDRHRPAKAAQVLKFNWGLQLIGAMGRIDSDMRNRSRHELMLAQFAVKKAGLLCALCVLAIVATTAVRVRFRRPGAGA